MTKNKLMKIGPKKPQFNCRGNGRRKRVRHTEVEKACEVVEPSRPLPTKMVTYEMLNPGPERMVHITREDIETIGVRFFRRPDIDYNLSKYHEDLVHSGQQVTVLLLRDKSVELHRNAGFALNSHNSTGIGISLFLRRTWRLRNLKLKGEVTRYDYTRSEFPNSDYITPTRKKKTAPRSKCPNQCPVALKNPAPLKSALIIAKKTTNAVEEASRVPTLFNLFSSSPPSIVQADDPSLARVPHFSEPPNGLHNLSTPSHSHVLKSSSSLLDLFSSPTNHMDTDVPPVSNSSSPESTSRNENSPGDGNLPVSNFSNPESTFRNENSPRDGNRFPRKRKPQTRKDIYLPGYSFPELLHLRQKNLSNDNLELLVNYVEPHCDDESAASELLYSALYESFATEE